MKRILKTLLYFLAAILGIIVILLIFTQTSWFREILKDKAEDFVSDQLNGNLVIGEIEGNLFENISLSEVKVVKKDTTLIYVDNLSLTYNLSGILFQDITIDSIKIDSSYLFLKQEVDSSWNVSGLLKDTAQQDTDTSESAFDWTINLNLLQLLRSQIKITTLDSSSNIPKRISDISLSAAGSLSAEQKKLEVNSLRLETEEPLFKLKDLNLLVKADENKIHIEKFILNTAQNTIQLSAAYYPDYTSNSTLNLSTAPLHFEEFKPFIPGVSIIAKPVIMIDGEYDGLKANIDLSVIDTIQSVLIKGFADSIQDLPDFTLEIDIDNFKAGQWTGSQLHSAINGKINITGSGNSIETLDLSSRVNIQGKISNLNLDSLHINTAFKNEDLLSNISLISGFGVLNGTIDLKGFQKENQFSLIMDFSKINVAPIVNDDAFNSDLNFSFSAAGQGLNPTDLHADIMLNMQKSLFQKYVINSIGSKIIIADGTYTIEKFNLLSDYAEVKLSGNMSLTKENDVNFNVVTKDMAALPDLNQFENVSINGEVNGNARGTFDSLKSKIDLSFNDITFQNNSLENLKGKIDFRMQNDSLSGNINTNLKNIHINSDEYSVNNIQLNSAFTNSEFDSELRVDINDTSKVMINSRLLTDSVITARINDFNFEISDYQWQNLKDTMIIKIADGKYTFKDFELSNGQQFIVVKGLLDQQKENDLTVHIKDLDLAELIRTVKRDMDLSAKINLDLDVKGTFKNPDVKGTLGIDQLSYDNKLKGSVNSQLEIKDRKFEYDLTLLLNNNEIKSDGYIPFDMEDTSSVIPRNRSLNINVDLNFPNLSLISEYIEPVDKFEGNIESHLKLTNNIRNLDVNGFFKVNNASMSSEIYGVNYNKINLDFNADGKNYLLNNMTIESNEGKLIIDGSAEFKQGIISSTPDNYEIHIVAKEFEIANSRNLEAKIDGNLNLITELSDTKFDGEIKVLRSRVFLPFFTGSESASENNKNKPILIKELEKSGQKKDSALVALAQTKKDTLSENKTTENIRGNFTLQIPKNSWIVSPDLNIELSGELDVLKNSNSFELYGNIETIRGKFSVYGKEFSIVEGRIIFNGGAELNPGLNVQLEYMFRGSDKSQRYLELIVTGTAKEPQLSFKVDDEEIDEGNVIAYLIYGRSLDELTQSQKSGVKNSKEDLAKTLAGSLVAAQLQSTLGDAVGLDVIEINGEDNWQQTTLTAGKYLTDDLFVSYEEGFGSSETNEVSPTIITLEYSLTSFLYFQLVEGNDKTSGFDVTFKFDF